MRLIYICNPLKAVIHQIIQSSIIPNMVIELMFLSCHNPNSSSCFPRRINLYSRGSNFFFSLQFPSRPRSLSHLSPHILCCIYIQNLVSSLLTGTSFFLLSLFSLSLFSHLSLTHARGRPPLSSPPRPACSGHRSSPTPILTE
jgi:hypothetical protein